MSEWCEVTLDNIDDFIDMECGRCEKLAVYSLKKGFLFYLSQQYVTRHKGKKKYKVGDIYYDNKLKVVKVYYEQKKWWQFWKRKKIEGYRMEYVGD